jgi:hypothetical protein
VVSYDDSRIRAKALMGLIGGVLLIVVIVIIQILFYRANRAGLEQRTTSQPYEALRALDAEQLEQLTSYGWVDERAGIAHISIERAMELIVAEAE